MKHTLVAFSVLLVGSIQPTNAQISGNQVYQESGNRYGNGNSIDKTNQVVVTNTSLTFTVDILLNQAADAYLVTLALNEEAATVKECNAAINNRIQRFQSALKSMGISPSDWYVDFIAQTRIYDYKVGEKQAEQISKGFEIKKNIIFKIASIDRFDELVTAAAEQEIYDVVKVEYINTDVEKIRQLLEKEAMALIEQRKQAYVQQFKVTLSGQYSLVNNQYYSVSPKTQYKNYQAFETAKLDVYRDKASESYVTKQARKSSTFYYDGVDVTGFDKVINPSVAKVGLQYVAKVSVQYNLLHP